MVMGSEREFSYLGLAYEDECGLWLKAPEFGVQLCTEDIEVGLDLLEEQIEAVLFERRRAGESVPERFKRTSVEHVGKEEYGMTQLEIDVENDFGQIDE